MQAPIAPPPQITTRMMSPLPGRSPQADPGGFYRIPSCKANWRVAKASKEARSALVRPPHDLHGAFDMPPFACFVGLAVALASLRIVRGLGDGRCAMLLEHLPRNGVDLRL
jgi:hypothetical protein